MIDNCHKPLYKDLTNKLMEKSEFADIILDNSSNNAGYRLNFTQSEVPGTGGIRLQVKDQYNRDLLTDGFLVDNKIIPWVFEEIKEHLGVE